jgi:hypothetical protein
MLGGCWLFICLSNTQINSRNEIQKGQENPYELYGYVGFFMSGLLSENDVWVYRRGWLGGIDSGKLKSRSVLTVTVFHWIFRYPFME